MRKPLMALVAVLVCSACASSTSQSGAPAAARVAALDPVGTFDFSTNAQGTDVTGAITITRTAAGGYGGSITTSVTEPIPITGVTVEGQTMHVVAETPDGQLTMSMVFTGNDFTGNWSLGGGAMAGVMSGRRRAS